ncbi:Glucose-repressible alcohol dehydrogenase transcriptional effector [Fusarium oxysporum f. sp. albedinis]|nr:Glucose-repressible alcohol dehydrogenase transcriptional effector [Fusarium oxysporum f. sp. albedinis]
MGFSPETVENEGQSVTSALFCITAHLNSVLVHESTFVLTENILDATFTECEQGLLRSGCRNSRKETKLTRRLK